MRGGEGVVRIDVLRPALDVVSGELNDREQYLTAITQTSLTAHLRIIQQNLSADGESNQECCD